MKGFSPVDGGWEMCSIIYQGWYMSAVFNNCEERQDGSRPHLGRFIGDYDDLE